MSSMKKLIISAFLIFIILALGGCEVKEYFVVNKKDYNLVNEDLEILLESNIKNSVYLRKENILNTYLIDLKSNDLLVVNINEITHVQNHYYKITIKINNFNKLGDITFEDAILQIDYINGSYLKIPLGVVNIIFTKEHFDLNLVNFKSYNDDNDVKSIIITLKNTSNINIQIKEIKLINGYFKADMTKYKDNKELLWIYKDSEITLDIPLICLNDTNKYETAIIIEYELLGNTKYKVIRNFLLYHKVTEEKEECYVTN